MQEYRNDNKISRQKRREKPKRHTRHMFINLFIILCCCMTVVILAIGRLTNNIPFSKDNQHNTHLSANEAANDDFNTGLTAHLQNNARDTSPQSDADDTSPLSDADDTSPLSDANDTTWCFILVNKWNYISDDYEVELTELANGQAVDKRIYPALQEMFDAARSNGVYPIVASGYRTAEKQQHLMDEKIADYKAEGYSAEEAVTKAEAWVAVPGTSEHQLGIAVDINADGIRSTGEEVYEWLNQNSYKFGFIRRYPADKTEITGVINEPWHYRYVGVDAATEIYNQGICLEEYLNKIN